MIHNYCSPGTRSVVRCWYCHYMAFDIMVGLWLKIVQTGCQDFKGHLRI